MNAYMSLLRSSQDVKNEFYKHLAPLALRSDSVDSNDLLFAHSSIIYRFLCVSVPLWPIPDIHPTFRLLISSRCLGRFAPPQRFQNLTSPIRKPVP